MVLPANHQTQQRGCGDNLSVFNEGTTTDKGEVTEKHQNLETECLNSVVDHLSEWDESELERKQQLQVVQDEIVISYPTSFAEKPLIDGVICDVLSGYPPPPTGDLRSFRRIIQALLFSFSPLSPAMLAGLLGFQDVSQVKRRLLPAALLIFIPKSEDNKKDDDRTPIRFIEPSMVDFFLDRTRSGMYYVDGPSAHRMLLDACTSVMEDVYGKETRLDMVGWGRREAFEYACRNWERHRRAGTRSKL